MGSNKKVWWKCEKGHEWAAKVNCRSVGGGCPYCSGNKACKDNCLATSNPELAKQWHPFKNGKLTPANVTPGSHKKVWWKCTKGHEWEARVALGSRSIDCFYCLRMIKKGEGIQNLVSCRT